MQRRGVVCFFAVRITHTRFLELVQALGSAVLEAVAARRWVCAKAMI